MLQTANVARFMPSYVVWTLVAIAAHIAATALLFAGMAHAERAPEIAQQAKAGARRRE